MSAWWSDSAVLFDLESDGVDPTAARIITACVALIGTSIDTVAKTWMLRPERDIDPKAVEVHGISTERARAEGMDRAEAVYLIAQRLTVTDAVTPVVGHNVRYDLTLLDREMRRLGIGSLGADGDLVTVRIDGRQVGAFHVIDTLVLDKAVDPYRRGSRKLVDVAAHYGVPIKGDAHTADADALAAGRIAWAIAKRCRMANGDGADGYDMGLQRSVMEMYADRKAPNEVARRFAEIGRMTLPDLHAAQVGWAAEQARGLADYFRKSGRGDPDSVSGAWPLEPVGAADAVADPA